MTGELFRRLNQDGVDIGAIAVKPRDLVELIRLLQNGTINQNAAREVFGAMWEEGGSPQAIVEAKGLTQISDSSELDGVVAGVIEANPDAIEKIKGGNQKPIQFLMGQVMKETRGKANPQLVVELLKKQIGV